MFKSLSLASFIVIISMTASQAMPSASTILQSQIKSVESQVQLTSGKKYKRAKLRRGYNRANSFASNQGPVKDTCPGGDKQCIKDLKANCDKAGGGLSTEPDGGVDCFVVGIHDQ